MAAGVPQLHSGIVSSSLSEIDPQPEAYANVIGIEIVSIVLEEVVSRKRRKETRVNRDVIADEPLQTDPRTKD